MFGIQVVLNDVPYIDYTGIVQYDNGDRFWFKNGKLHRNGGPACKFKNGTKKWYLNGKLHRHDGPAVEHIDGSKEWWFHGQPKLVN